MITKFKKFKVFENIKEEELNNLLDKISKYGKNSLTNVELSKLKNYNNPDFNEKNELIDDIINIVNKNNGNIFISDLQPEFDIIHDIISTSLGEMKHRVEFLMDDSVNISVYLEGDELIDEYSLTYDQLGIDVLQDIYKLLIEKSPIKIKK
jgi:hypothetical protein